MKKRKVFLVSGGAIYRNMFNQEPGWELTQDQDSADLIQFCGGADVSPELYGEEHHKKTITQPSRDRFEVKIYNQFVGHIPMAGICRGGQLLWVLNGGKLYQDVGGHVNVSSHPIFDKRTNIELAFPVTSTHHQMMKWDKEFDDNILAYAKCSTYKEEVVDGVLIKTTGPSSMDVEVAHFPKTNCLCFQGHPEMYPGQMRKYYFQLISDYLVPAR